MNKLILSGTLSNSGLDDVKSALVDGEEPNNLKTLTNNRDLSSHASQDKNYE